MKRILVSIVAGAGLLLLLGAAKPADRAKTYSVTADTIEGCSCPLFCTCYFSASADEHSCQFNNVYKFRKGSHYGDVDLSGQMVWLSGDLGGEWHHHPGPGMPMKWAVVTFDKASSAEQKKAITQIVNNVFNVKWEKLDTREDSISWHEDGKTAHAKMASGMAEITLDKALGPDKHTPTIVKNLQYWFSNSNDGFALAFSKHHFDGDTKFSQEHKNGFTIAWKASGNVEAAKTQAGGR